MSPREQPWQRWAFLQGLDGETASPGRSREAPRIDPLYALDRKKTNEPGIRNRMAWLICFEEEKEQREIEGYLTTG